jgi:hypothetical protein
MLNKALSHPVYNRYPTNDINHDNMEHDIHPFIIFMEIRLIILTK